MHVVGGLYRELCEHPYWDATMGSGARAALAVASLAPNIKFSTYASYADRPAIASLEQCGVTTTIATRPSPIVFAYFHPLSSPYIQPKRDAITPQPALRVTGNAVLRFGFLEGDAIVTANRAVYDPQTWRDPQPFGANGSTAGELALVMNELEVQMSTGISDLRQAADHLIRSQDAQVVVIKRGPYGATVFDVEGGSAHVPAYRSASVFKIGTGDIFSAIFAYYWAEMRMPALEAADLASRSVSVYCETRALNFDQVALHDRQPVFANRGASVRLESATNALGQRYVLEEARFSLSELGVNVLCPALEPGISVEKTHATLAIYDELPIESMGRIAQDAADGIDVIWLTERTGMKMPNSPTALTTPDFTSSIYYAAWAAGEVISRR